jgi:hypothetical protein
MVTTLFDERLKSQYEAGPEELERREKVYDLREKADNIRNAWDSWQEFNKCLHSLNPPQEIVDAWDKIRPWLKELGEETLKNIEELEGR